MLRQSKLWDSLDLPVVRPLADYLVRVQSVYAIFHLGHTCGYLEQQNNLHQYSGIPYQFSAWLPPAICPLPFPTKVAKARGESDNLCLSLSLAGQQQETSR
ncbi:hypothetical protein PoB_001643000 [Plakobranchus ocellatus]|uniref:Uncharacterized protein n=1 Tax=Plakobranchus ocellatus TaxID=259542 RepID=A0AAV3Z445_9GAST|nr:hypothetical protein PoB_001643000 [Plakobranchus ocellatus]